MGRGGDSALPPCAVLGRSSGTGRGGHREIQGLEGGGPSPCPASSPQDRGGGRSPLPRRGPDGSCQRRLPCTSCPRQRPLRQCHTAARVTTWPTTTSDGNRLPEGSMALGLHGCGQSGRSLPSLPGRRWRGGGAPGACDRPACKTALLYRLPGAPETSAVHSTNCAPARRLCLLPPGHSEVPTHLPQRPAQLSLRTAITLKVSWSLNPCLPTATPARRRGL